MKEKPILFNTEMVRAILDGRKTQTRRPVLKRGYQFLHAPVKAVDGRWYPVNYRREPIVAAGEVKCPLGTPGDLLWVRETWAYTTDYDGQILMDGRKAIYRATDPDYWICRWRPSIHMPRWASRITLRVRRVWVERVQDISHDDIRAEGVNLSSPFGMEYTGEWLNVRFMQLWDSIYAKKNLGWSVNPWVFAAEFERVEQ